MIAGAGVTSLRLGERDLTEDEILDLMVDYPDPIHRPIVEKAKYFRQRCSWFTRAAVVEFGA